jgi:ABC-type lipoprotein release transport system permease subunit
MAGALYRCLVIIIAAMVATCQPARQAARIDPAITLRAE